MLGFGDTAMNQTGKVPDPTPLYTAIPSCGIRRKYVEVFHYVKSFKIHGYPLYSYN